MKTLKNLNQKNLLFFDIETAPVVAELELDTPLFDSWNYKVNKKGEMSNEEVIASFSTGANLYPEFGKVVSIVVGKIVKDKIFLITLDHDSEVDLLNEFNEIIERNIKCKLVGFVNIAFDTPFIFKRMIINGIEANKRLDYTDEKPWTISDIDLAMEWKSTSFERASLINVATALGLPSPKSDISGTDVGRVYWEEGKEGLARISKYCGRDVVTTVNVFRKMILQEPLEEGVFTPKIETVDPLIQRIFDGGKYGAAEKKELVEFLNTLSEEDQDKTFILLDAVTSTARGKKTKMTKTHVKALKTAVRG